MGVADLAAPRQVGDVGVQRSTLEDLFLKTLYQQGEASLRELSDLMHLDFGVVEHIFFRTRKEQLCEVKGMVGGVHVVATTSEGKRRALELLALNQYAGPAPVSLADYVARVRMQGIEKGAVRSEGVRRVLSHLVLWPDTIDQVGTAVASGNSLFLHGPPGTGKTAIAEALPAIFEDEVWIPHAVEVDGQIITVYDATVHQAIERTPSDDEDRRWVLCRRPRVLVGGELTVEMLDLQFNPISKFYSAPVQVKANNGVLVVDDFGRQRVRPEELLNRWIVPLDRKIDFLSLVGGRKIEMPFDLFVVFATNLKLTDLADDAFLRRISNKIRVDFVNGRQFHEIFKGVCKEHGLKYEERLVSELITALETKYKEPLRPCYPRDLVRQIHWRARYEGREPQFTAMELARACMNYFVVPEG